MGMNIKKEFATIKERRAVADLLAIKAGRAARGPEDIQKAANMSDTEIKQYLKDNSPEVVEVEEIRPDGGAVPADLFGFCNGLLTEFCDKFNLDIYKLTSLQWGAACSYVGRGFTARSCFRVSSDNFIKGSNKKIDAQAAAGVVPVYRDLCGLYNQVPLIDHFCRFCGFSVEYIFKLEKGDGVTPDDIQLLQKIRNISRNGLDNRLLSRDANVGAIFYAKAKEGYQEKQTTVHIYENKDGSGALLPDFGKFSELPDKNG